MGIGVGGGKKFNGKVSYVMGKALSGELSCPCDRSCCLSSHCGQLVKERIFSCWCKFFSVRVGPRWKDFVVKGSKRKSQKLFPGKNMGKMVEKYGCVSIFLIMELEDYSGIILFILSNDCRIGCSVHLCS